MTGIEAHPLELYLPLLIEGNGRGLQALFGGEPIIHDPRFGHVTAGSSFEQYVTLSREWLEYRQARVEPVVLTRGKERAVYECLLHLEPGETGGPPRPIDLPVALSGDMEDGRLAALRIYHSLWPLLGAHQVRPPLLEDCEDVKLPDVVKRYHDALRAGDAETIAGLFEDTGLAREPSGGVYAYHGHDQLREFYGKLLSQGGIRLEYCQLTDDGQRAALEYNAVGWGQADLPPQAGLAVYERGVRGLLSAARIYDDVDPPLPD